MTINKHGAEWQTIRRANLTNIEKHRLELESLDVDPDRAHQLRGMIFALREQISDVEPTPTPDVKDLNYG